MEETKPIKLSQEPSTMIEETKPIKMSQELATMILPVVTGLISFICSTTVIIVIFRSDKKLSSTLRRLMFGMSVTDIVYSVAWIASSFPAPKDSTTAEWKSFGNTTTCTIQGLSMYIGNIGSTMYSCFIGLFFALTVARGMKDDIMTKKVEPFFHTFAVCFIIVSSCILLPSKSFNAGSDNMCFIASIPQSCQNDPEIACTRGEHSRLFKWYFVALPMILAFLVMLPSMASIYLTVRRQEKKMQKYTINIRNLRTQVEGENSENTREKVTIWNRIGLKRCIWPESRVTRRRRSEALCLTQCFLFVFCYFLSHFFRLLHFFEIKSAIIAILCHIFSSSQGLFNFLIFIRPQVNAIRENDTDVSIPKAILMVVVSRTGFDSTTMRRRSSLQLTQANGGNLFTAREFYQHELLREEANDNKSHPGPISLFEATKSDEVL